MQRNHSVYPKAGCGLACNTDLLSGLTKMSFSEKQSISLYSKKGGKKKKLGNNCSVSKPKPKGTGRSTLYTAILHKIKRLSLLLHLELLPLHLMAGLTLIICAVYFLLVPLWSLNQI